MTVELGKIGLGGGCHWCTEAVFQSLRGVHEVRSGWISSEGENSTESEGVLVHFDPEQINSGTLIEIHLLTHASTSNHSMRRKYRSAVYVFSERQAEHARSILQALTKRHGKPHITQVLRFTAFRSVSEAYKNYYYTAPDRPFCVNMIEPKLKKLVATHGEYFAKTHLGKER